MAALDDLVELAPVEPHAPALGAVVDLDALALGHQQVHVAVRALHRELTSVVGTGPRVRPTGSTCQRAPHDDLAQLLDHQDREGDERGDAPLLPGEVLGAEQRLQRVPDRGQHLEHDHATDDRPEAPVGEGVAAEHRAVLGAGVEDVDHLLQHEGGEGHGEGDVLAVAVAGPHEHGEHADGHDHAEEHQAADAAAGEDRGVAGGSGVRSITPGWGLSTPRVMAGGPSAMRFTHSTWIGVNGTGRPNERRAEDGADGAHVRGQLEPHELDDVVVDRAAPLDGADDGGEVVVGEHHVAGFLGDLGAGDAHGHADVGPAQRRGVVHAVAGHGHDVAAALERLDDPHLVLGRHPGAHADVVDLVGELLVGHRRRGRRR